MEESTEIGSEVANNQHSISTGQRQSKRDLIEWRYNKIIELASKGMKQSEIAEILQLDKSTICKDVRKLRARAREEISDFLENVLPFEHKKTIAGYDEVIKQCWKLATDKDPRVVLQALGEISNALAKRDEALVNPFYIQKAITARARYWQGEDRLR